MTRAWAMPNALTFLIPPIATLLDEWLALADVIIDPFARDSKRGTITNDLNPDTSAQFHMPAEDFVTTMAPGSADIVLFDPPYSPGQMVEAYQGVGMRLGNRSSQNAYLYRVVKDGLDRALRPGGTAICFGWNSAGFGVVRGYELLELLLVAHGGAHNDTIVTVERKGEI